jgi:hypothetical protein
MGSKLWQRIPAVPLSTLAKVRKAPNPFFSSREKGLGDKGKAMIQINKSRGWDKAIA